MPLALVLLGFLVYSLPPYSTLDPATARTVLNEGFAAHYPLLVLHIATGTIAMLTVVLQVWPWLRARHPRVHRVSGRLYVFAGVLPSAVIALVILPYTAVLPGAVGAAVTAVLWLVTTAAGFVRARQRRFAEHRRWMIYSFALTASIVWGRVIGIGLGGVLGGMGLDLVVVAEMAGWMGTVINLVLAQWWLARTSRAD
ncbi:DUF2306 domain-containing protein [Saccharothrix sp.]|uniref:DUF2306 domain-containing protein n=1 Tax=Saccharothrix sp. TaxID=1873460 RepID=UPI002811393A|nr:DUF2306 domain-containing protein [Saccharothrix sp.]